MLLLTAMLCGCLAGSSAFAEEAEVPLIEEMEETPAEIPEEEIPAEPAGETWSEPAEENPAEPAGETPTAALSEDEKSLEARVEEKLASMTLEEKILQMFVSSPEQLTGVDYVTAAGEATQAAINRMPVGGLIYMSSNLESMSQIREMLSNTQQFSMERIGLPMFLCVDEEGGTVRRVNGRGILEGEAETEVPSMRYVGSTGDTRYAYSLGEQMGKYLSGLGFNVDFAPVADTLTNPDNQVVADRCFGSDPGLTASMAVCVMHGLQQYHVAATFKHFPGHGSTSEDSHEGYAISYQNMEQLAACDLVPFAAGVDNGVDMIMTAHISLPEVTGDMTPASLSFEVVTGILREQLGYDGLVITDALEMGAISQNYSSGDASVLAIEAGNDLILMPTSLDAAYEGVYAAVQSGRLTEERIDESVRRILRWKLR